MERNLLEGVVLSGGGALLNGMCDMAERVVKCQARTALATENDIGEWPEGIKEPVVDPRPPGSRCTRGKQTPPSAAQADGWTNGISS